MGTVDALQGQERAIIAITLTRSNPLGEIGFLSGIRRMNVGMTRARRKLLLVGDLSTLCSHPFFGEMLAYVKGVGGYRMAHEMGKPEWSDTVTSGTEAIASLGSMGEAWRTKAVDDTFKASARRCRASTPGLGLPPESSRCK